MMAFDRRKSPSERGKSGTMRSPNEPMQASLGFDSGCVSSSLIASSPRECSFSPLKRIRLHALQKETRIFPSRSPRKPASPPRVDLHVSPVSPLLPQADNDQSSSNAGQPGCEMTSIAAPRPLSLLLRAKSTRLPARRPPIRPSLPDHSPPGKRLWSARKWPWMRPSACPGRFLWPSRRTKLRPLSQTQPVCVSGFDRRVCPFSAVRALKR